MLGNTKGKLINQYVPDYVLYDLETVSYTHLTLPTTERV